LSPPAAPKKWGSSFFPVLVAVHAPSKRDAAKIKTAERKARFGFDENPIFITFSLVSCPNPLPSPLEYKCHRSQGYFIRFHRQTMQAVAADFSGYPGKPPPLFELRRVRRWKRSRHSEATADSAVFWRGETKKSFGLFILISDVSYKRRVFHRFPNVDS
jgi:hypothetical protein